MSNLRDRYNHHLICILKYIPYLFLCHHKCMFLYLLDASVKLYWHSVCFKTVISFILLRSQKYIKMLSISNSKVFLLFQGFFSEKERLNFLLVLAFFILLVRYVIHIAESLFLFKFYIL